MKYMLLIYATEDPTIDRESPEYQDYMQAFFRFEAEVKESGAHVAGEPLEPVSTATTVRVRDGERLVTDGPFAETKEQLGGFYMVEAADIDEAIEWAAKIPTAQMGSIEVRPLMHIPGAD